MLGLFALGFNFLFSLNCSKGLGVRLDIFAAVKTISDMTLQLLATAIGGSNLTIDCIRNHSEGTSSSDSSDKDKSIRSGKTFRRKRVPSSTNFYTKRFYFDDAKKFKHLLMIFNHSEAAMYKSFQCVGYANVAMQLCTSCGDSGKHKRDKDRYYVDINEITKNRTILCHGCIGYLLKEMESEERNDCGR